MVKRNKVVLPIIRIPALTIGLLFGSNSVMTFARHGHLRFTDAPLLMVMLISWGIALYAYMLPVPAIRHGYGTFNAAHMKTIRQVITTVPFAIFSTLALKKPLSRHHALCLGLIALDAWVIFDKWT